MSILTPKSFFSSIYEITTEFIREKGIKAIVSDIDNTLVTYDDPVPTEKLMAWFKGLERAGIKLAFISNNFLRLSFWLPSFSSSLSNSFPYKYQFC